MPAALFVRLSDLVPEALALPPAERGAFLGRACTHADGTPDADLLSEAAALVDASDAADASGALASPVRAVVAALPDAIGPWRVTGLLGEGGMGIVYAAERTGAGFIQRAALKRVRAGVGADFEARFVRERGLLARLDHPGIARLLDGGVDDAGRPYLAMERVDGAPLSDAAEGLAVPARVALFLDACDAVAYAHAHLVVHRDLKPAHILVTPSGTETGAAARVTLLDFGVAKLLDAGDDDVLTTRTGHALMTTQYAAPEQLLGEPVTTATDVYALGLVLFETLAGQRPYALAGLSAAQAERVVCEGTIGPPSAVASPEHARAIRGDLDRIVLKALAREPGRRYASAEALAADLRRALAGLPVEARPATTAYRAGRFVRRHRTGVAATALVAIALVVGAGMAVWQADLARAERDRAQTEADKATAISSFLQQTLLAAGPSVGAAVRPSELRVVDVLRPAAAAAQRAFPGQPDVRAAVLATLGQTYFDLGLWDEAQAAVMAALAIRDSLYRGTPHEDRIASYEAASKLASWTGRQGEGLAWQQRALALRRARYGADSPETAVGLRYVANAFAAADRTDDAFTAARASLEMARRTAGPASMEAAVALNGLAFIQLQNDEVVAADSAYRVLLATAREALPPDDPRLGWLAHYASVARIFLGDSDGAARFNSEARRIAEARLDVTSPVLAETRGIRGGLLVDRGRFSEALALLAPARATYDAAMTQAGHDERHIFGAEYAAALAGSGRTAEAEPLLRAHVAGLRRAFGDRNGWSRHAARHLADLLDATGRPDEARPFRAVADAPHRDGRRPDPRRP